ncbi:MAG: hypothetical protein V5A64_00660 [Candidatus Thermoplasmatota archaeon]
MVIFITIAIFFIISIILGILSLLKYSKTKEKNYLWIGLLLTLVIPGLLTYILIWWINSQTTAACYAPTVNAPDVKIIGLSITPLFIKQRDNFIKKFEEKVPRDVLKKINKKKTKP